MYDFPALVEKNGFITSRHNEPYTFQLWETCKKMIGNLLCMQNQSWFEEVLPFGGFHVLLEVNASPTAYQNFTIS